MVDGNLTAMNAGFNWVAVKICGKLLLIPVSRRFGFYIVARECDGGGGVGYAKLSHDPSSTRGQRWSLASSDLPEAVACSRLFFCSLQRAGQRLQHSRRRQPRLPRTRTQHWLRR